MRKHRRSLWSDPLFSFIFPISAGALCTGGCCLLFSALTFFVLKTMIFAGVFSAVSLVSGGVCSGFICGKFRRRLGLMDGLICGGALAAGLIAAAAAVTGELPLLWKPLLVTAAGAVGGVVGVNSKRPAKLM